MSWNVNVSGHEQEGPNPPEKEKLDAVTQAAIDEAHRQGLTPTNAYNTHGNVDTAKAEDDEA